MTTAITRQPLSTLALILSLLVLFPAWSKAGLTEDIQGLTIEAENLEIKLQDISLVPGNICGPLVEANQAARDLANGVSAIDESLAEPLQVDEAMLEAIEKLSVSSLALASEALRLSLDLNSLYQVASAITIKDGITAMLQLSDDIGAMADRIGLMSDKILVMADNIGLMADRILLTQQLQNDNILLTMDAILQTQTNMLTLVSYVESQTYDLDMDWISVQGGMLAARMQAVMLNPFTMGTQLAGVAEDVRIFLNDVKAISDDLVVGTVDNTIYINHDSLLHLTNMSSMLTSLATAVDGYVVAINGLQATTSRTTLYNSMKSMLQLSADIGVMSNRILEMGDVILAMADNIGMEADQILLTQQAQNANVATTQASILAAQEMAITIITVRNLD